MGYRFKQYRLASGLMGFKILHEVTKDGVRRARGVPRHEWRPLGLLPTMSADEVKARLAELNGQEHLRRHENRRQSISERLAESALAELAYLPNGLVAEFERTKLRRGSSSPKVIIYWRKCRAILAELRLEPEDWAESKERFYDWFAEHNISMSYTRTLISMLNQWGRFVTHRRRSYFEPLAGPRGIERERINDANFENRGRGNKESAPLTPKMLEKAVGGLKPELHLWLRLTVWFGLRPSEVDALKDPKSFRIEQHGRMPVLWVYQSKLKSIARDKRWKYIPAIHKEQCELVGLIKGGFFKRPLSKTVASYFGETVTLYGGRKGFEELMTQLGQKLEDISTWLGHTSIERTWRNYKNRQSIRFTPL